MSNLPDATEAMITQAQTEESNSRVAAILEYEQGRSFTLNVEVRRRDARIEELEERLASILEQLAVDDDLGGEPEEH